jgi:hypothetical protein
MEPQMIVTKELLEKLESQIGHDCHVAAIPDELGLRLRAEASKPETKDRLYQERIFSFAEMRHVRDTRILQDNFVLEAKSYFDHVLFS